jgi:hypothetical protein
LIGHSLQGTQMAGLGWLHCGIAAHSTGNYEPKWTTVTI